METHEEYIVPPGPILPGEVADPLNELDSAAEESTMIHLEVLDVVEVAETSSITETNEYLRAGWRLLSTRTQEITRTNHWTVYVLGWPRTAGAVVNPVMERYAKREAERLADLREQRDEPKQLAEPEQTAEKESSE
jgi:hypothetical protein